MQNLEIKKLTDDKKNALAAQFAAEATLRRVHANQKDDDAMPIESVLAPLEAEIKMYKNEVGDEIKSINFFHKLIQYDSIMKVAHAARSFSPLLSSQIAALQEDKKALERLTKSKESALLEAERILRSALERALIVEEVQNQNFELKRQIEICQARFYNRYYHIS